MEEGGGAEDFREGPALSLPCSEGLGPGSEKTLRRGGRELPRCPARLHGILLRASLADTWESGLSPSLSPSFL